jgi:hypothetical protein
MDKRSDIIGEGYGDKHAWKYQCDATRQTLYRCADCGATFWHNYNRVPDIFEAMKICGIPAECEPATTLTETVKT